MKSFAHRFGVILVIVAVSCSACGGLAAARSQVGLVFNSRSSGRSVIPKMDDPLYKIVERMSPDGKYLAELNVLDSQPSYLVVYKLRSSPKSGSHRLVRHVFENANGCAWIPGHGHWLTISAGGCDYGRGFLALWAGPKDTRFLRRAKSEVGEGYDLRSVSADGHSLVYEHFGENSSDPDDKRTSRIVLTLPSR